MAVGGYCPDCGTSLLTRLVEDCDRAYCPACDAIIWDNPLPVAWVRVIDGDRTLLVKRAEPPDQGTWDVPGGFLEVDEGFRGAAVRELAEETGIEIEAAALTLQDTFTFYRAGERVVGVVFQALVDAADHAVVAGDEVAAAQFWQLEDLADGDERLRECCRQVLDTPSHVS